MLKISILVAMVVTLVLLWWDYKRDQENKKGVLINFGYFLSVVAFAIVGTLTKPIFLLYFSYILFLILSWGSLVWYIIKKNYHLPLHILPIIPIAIYILGELLLGSGNIFDL